MAMSNQLAELIVADSVAWREWLAAHNGDPKGVWLVLARKGTTEPTSLNYDQALEEALCQGWIDGQAHRRDESTYLQRFTPRRARSGWSSRNVGIVERLTREGRMRPAGLAEVREPKPTGAGQPLTKARPASRCRATWPPAWQLSRAREPCSRY